MRFLKHTCTNPAKFIKICWTEYDIPLFNLAAAAFQNPDLQKLPVIVHEISVNGLAQNVSNSTNQRAASIDSTRQSVKVSRPLAKLHALSQSVTDRLTFVDRLADREHSFLRIFNPIRPNFGAMDSYLQSAAKINNKDTLKVCRKITKITDPNLGFFLSYGANLKMKFPAQRNFKNYRFKSILIDRNCFLSIIIDKKNYWFLPKYMKSMHGPLYRLRLLFLQDRTHSSPHVYPYTTKPYWVFT